MRKPVLGEGFAHLVAGMGAPVITEKAKQSARRAILEQLKGEIERATGLKVARLWLDERGAVRVEYDEENPKA